LQKNKFVLHNVLEKKLYKNKWYWFCTSRC